MWVHRFTELIKKSNKTKKPFFQYQKIPSRFPFESLSAVNAMKCIHKLHGEKDVVAIDVLGEHLHHAFDEVIITL